MAVSQDEPIWSINMKKAIVSKLQLHVSGTRSIESASRNFAQGDDSDDVNAIFKVFEVSDELNIISILNCIVM